MVLLLLLPNLSILLLACNTRRAFLGATRAATTATATVAFFPIWPPSSAVALLGDGPTSTAASDLYLARPMGVSRDDNDDGIGTTAIRRPSAPLKCLLPAARVGLYVYRALSAAEDLERSIDMDRANGREGGEGGGGGGTTIATTTTTTTTRDVLDGIFLNPPPFVRVTDPSVSRGDPYASLPPIIGELAVQRRKAEERRYQGVNAGLAPQFFEVGQLIGERRQWNRLSDEERIREDMSEVRRALNIYTTNINYDPNRYIYSGSKEEKKRYIRGGNLPTAGDVIRSDLDARDLYRNELQTSLDDARAEYLYQSGKDFEDALELVSLLRTSRDAIDGWFDFVPDGDIKKAMEIVRGEEAQTK